MITKIEYWYNVPHQFNKHINAINKHKHDFLIACKREIYYIASAWTLDSIHYIFLQSVTELSLMIKEYF